MRRTTVLLLLATALLAVACQPSWTQPRGDLARSGHQPDAEAVTEAAVAGLTPLWSTPLGAVGSDPLVPGPVVARGTAVVAAGDHVLAYPTDGSGCGPVSGECAPTWTGRLPSDGPPQATIFSAAVHGGTVYVVYGGDEGQGIALFPLDPGDACAGDPLVCDPVATIPGEHLWTPVAVDGTLYTVSVEDLPSPPGGSSLIVLGYDLVACLTGPACDPVWKGVGPDGQPFGAIGASPTVADGHLWVSSDLPLAWDLEGGGTCAGSAPEVCTPALVVDPERAASQPSLVTGALPVEAGIGVGVSVDDTATARLEVFATTAGPTCDPGPTPRCPVLGSVEVADSAYPRPTLVDGIAHVAGEDGGDLVVQAIDVATCAAGGPCAVGTRWAGPPTSPWVLSTTVAGEVVFATSAQGPVAFARDPVGCGSAASPCAPLWVAGTPATHWSEVVVAGDLVLAVGGVATAPSGGIDATLHVWQLPEA